MQPDSAVHYTPAVVADHTPDPQGQLVELAISPGSRTVIVWPPGRRLPAVGSTVLLDGDGQPVGEGPPARRGPVARVVSPLPRTGQGADRVLVSTPQLLDLVATVPPRLRSLTEGARVLLDFTFSVVLDQLDEGVAQRPADSARLRSFDEVAGYEELCRHLDERVVQPARFRRVARRYGVPVPRVLLHGPPGVGKTLLAEAVATATAGAEEPCLFVVRGPELLSEFTGQAERRLREVFDRAARAAAEGARPVILFDELEAMFARRQGTVPWAAQNTLVATLLSRLDGVGGRDPVLVLATTNRPELLDEALLRNGRFDLKVAVPRPGEAACRAILRHHLAPLSGARLPDDAVEVMVETLFDAHTRVADPSGSGRGVAGRVLVSGAFLEGIAAALRSRFFVRVLAGNTTGLPHADLAEAVRGALEGAWLGGPGPVPPDEPGSGEERPSGRAQLGGPLAVAGEGLVETALALGRRPGGTAEC